MIKRESVKQVFISEHPGAWPPPFIILQFVTPTVFAVIKLLTDYNYWYLCKATTENINKTKLYKVIDKQNCTEHHSQLLLLLSYPIQHIAEIYHLYQSNFLVRQE